MMASNALIFTSKLVSPDSTGHGRIFTEGFYFHGKRVGVWKRRNYDGSFIAQDLIFMDTSESVIQEINYYKNGRMNSRGMLTIATRKDSLLTIDLKTNEPKWDTVVRYFVMNGAWQFYWENGQVKSSGNFKNDAPTGTWRNYNEKGELIKTEEYE